MRTICDVCESAAAILFCASDEAVLCRSCDEKIHMCNKLAVRHVRVGLADPSAVPCCDICENAPAYFYCEIDGSSLCLQCDMIVHVGGKRIHGRYLLFKMRVEFPGDKPGRFEEPALQQTDREFRREQYQAPELIVKKDRHQQNHGISSVPVVNRNTDSDPQMENETTDAGPDHRNRQALNNEDINVPSANNNKSVGVVPVRPHESGLENEQETLLV